MIDLRSLKGLLAEGLEQDIIQAALENLNSNENKLAVNNFAYALRSALDEFFKRVAPVEEIKACAWYVPPTVDEVARGAKDVNVSQKIQYAIQGGLSDTQISQLDGDFDVGAKRKSLKDLHSKLSGYTHITLSSFNVAPEKKLAFVEEVSQVTTEFVAEYQALREQLESLITDTYIQDKALHSLFEDHHSDLADMAAQFDSATFDEHQIEKITSSQVVILLTGTADCEHIMGGKHDACSIDGSYPFEVRFLMPLNNLGNLDIDLKSFTFDTSSWYGTAEELEAESRDEAV